MTKAFPKGADTHNAAEVVRGASLAVVGDSSLYN